VAVQREYLSPNEIAELLGVSPFTIRRYIKLGELRAVKLLGGFRVHRDDLQRFLKAHEVNSTHEQLSPEEPADATPTPELKMSKEAPFAKSRPAPGPVPPDRETLPATKRRERAGKRTRRLKQ
jgi:excisionase family DNA binding protein